MLEIGNAQIQRVEEATLQVPLSYMGTPQGLIDANRHWLAPDFLDTATGDFTMVFQSWLLQLDGLTVLVDPCNGNGRNRPVFPHFHQLNQPWLERFEATGIRPEQVDLVFCTHLHCDHCSWNTQLRDGRWVPTFPNARYLFVRREVARWGDKRDSFPHIEYNVGVYEESIKPVIDAGLAELVDDHHAVSPELAIEPAHGHSVGHSILRVASAGESLYFTGDVFHHPVQILNPELDLGGVDDLPAAIATRHRLRQQISEQGAVFLPAHFPKPHGGRIVRRGEDYGFEPLADDAWGKG